MNLKCPQFEYDNEFWHPLAQWFWTVFWKRNSCFLCLSSAIQIFRGKSETGKKHGVPDKILQGLQQLLVDHRRFRIPQVSHPTGMSRLRSSSLSFFTPETSFQLGRDGGTSQCWDGVGDETTEALLGRKLNNWVTKKKLPGDSSRDLVIPIWESPTTRERVTFSPSCKGHKRIIYQGCYISL